MTEEAGPDPGLRPVAACGENISTRVTLSLESTNRRPSRPRGALEDGLLDVLEERRGQRHGGGDVEQQPQLRRGALVDRVAERELLGEVPQEQAPGEIGRAH